MNQIKLIFGYTFRDAVRKKSFKISTVIILLIVLIITSLTRIIPSEEQEAEGSGVPVTENYSGYTLYYLDDGNIIKDAKEALGIYMPGAEIIVGFSGKLDEYKAELADDKNITIVNVALQEGIPFITVTAGDFMSRVSPAVIADALSKRYASNALTELGFDETAVAVAQLQLPYEYDLAGGMNLSGYAVGILLTMLTFFAIYYYGYGVAMSVAAEKTSRVMETLVVSAKPSRILIGKCFAMGVVGLIQFTAVISFAAICYRLIIPESFMIMGMPVSFSAFTLRSALLVLVYFILGYCLYAVLNSVCGATVSKIEDLNSALMPVTLISLIAFYFGYISAAMGSDGMMTKVAMYLPFSSPFIMPFKLLNGNVSASDVAISVVLLIAFLIIFTNISIRMYSASVLHYGKRLKFGVLYKTKL